MRLSDNKPFFVARGMASHLRLKRLPLATPDGMLMIYSHQVEAVAVHDVVTVTVTVVA